MASDLPIDFECEFSDACVIVTKPTSDDTYYFDSYEGDHMMKRRMFVCIFDETNHLVACEDWAESAYLDNRWRNKGGAMGFCIHCKEGKAVSRSSLRLL